MRELPLTVIHRENESCVRRVPIFSGLDTAQQDSVATLARPTRVPRGELLHVAGDDSGRLFVVHTGSLKLVRTTASGRERLIRVANPGDVVGEHSFLTGEPPEYYAEATTDAQLCVFRHSDLAGLVQAYPAIALEMMRSLSGRLVDSERRLSLETADVGARIASYLLSLPTVAGGNRGAGAGAGAHSVAGSGPRVRLPLAKKDVASFLGTTPESFSRALAKLQQSGAVTSDGDAFVLDVEALEALEEGA